MNNYKARPTARRAAIAWDYFTDQYPYEIIGLSFGYNSVSQRREWQAEYLSSEPGIGRFVRFASPDEISDWDEIRNSPMKPGILLVVLELQERAIAEHEAEINRAWERARFCPVPANLRPATHEDLKPWSVLWFPDRAAGFRKFDFVERIIDPPAPFHAYESRGCIHGIEDAFVEVTE